MRIGRPLLKLPVRFCGETLAREVAALPESAWMEHPQKYDGNIAVPLVSAGGGINDQTIGPMAPTDWLRRCPYILEIMQALDSTWGRSRLMALEPGAVVPDHVDIHYYWRTHLRIHIPVITNPGVAFICNGESVHMPAGECWILDSFYPHSVVNGGSERRVHLVLDTVGSGHLWDLIEAANAGADQPVLVEPGKTRSRRLEFEQVNASLIMSPWEMKAHLAYITEWTEEQPGLEPILTILDRFLMVWTGTWARYGVSDQGLPVYTQHIQDVREQLASLDGPEVRMRNDRPILVAVDHFLLTNATRPLIMKQMRAGSPGRAA